MYFGKGFAGPWGLPTRCGRLSTSVISEHSMERMGAVFVFRTVYLRFWQACVFYLCSAFALRHCHDIHPTPPPPSLPKAARQQRASPGVKTTGHLPWRGRRSFSHFAPLVGHGNVSEPRDQGVLQARLHRLRWPSGARSAHAQALRRAGIARVDIGRIICTNARCTSFWPRGSANRPPLCRPLRDHAPFSPRRRASSR